ncbi:MAG: DEAD/DEAH box helicase [Rickettsia endosymbiont of Bryobia graminum]|nr:DEAD/DEAH box helicase [Rickettsia endosymbiont of Bryobia graminum]
MSCEVNYTIKDVVDNFLDKDYLRGKAYSQQGKVTNLVYNNDRKLFARVQGTRRTPYEVEVEIIAGINNTKQFLGICSCPLGYECKHIVATLLEGIKILNSDNKIIDVTSEKLVQKENTTLFDHGVKLWLENCKKQTDNKTTNASGKILIYVISSSNTQEEAFIISPVTAYILKNGSFSNNQKPYRLEQMHYRAEYIQDNDATILNLISGLVDPFNKHNSSLRIPTGEGALLLLKLLINTKRCYLTNEGLPKNYLTMGEVRKAQLKWKTQSDGSQTINVIIENVPSPILLPLEPIHYICPISRTIGIANLNLDMPIKQVRHLLKAPVIKPQQITAVNKELMSIFDNLPTELLPSELSTTNLEINPVPILKLSEATIYQWKSGSWGSRVRANEPISVAVASLAFDYGGKSIDYYDQQKEISRFKDGQVQIINRNKQMEQGVIDYLQHLGFNISFRDMSNYYDVKKEYHNCITIGIIKENFHKDKTLKSLWEHFVHHDIARLKELGWQIKMLTSFPYNIVYADDEWYAEVQDDSNHWFNVELGINLDGARVNLIPILLELLRKDNDIFSNLEKITKNNPFLISLKDGRRLALPPERLKTLLSTIQYLFSFQDNIDKSEKLRMQNLDSALLVEIEAAAQSLNMRWFGGERIRELGKNLKDFDSIKEVGIPKNFHGQLRNYQKDGLDWLQFLRKHQLSGILADDMGLGKTVQVLAHIATEKANQSLHFPILVIAPTSLMVNWRTEAKRFTPDIKVLTLHGLQRKAYFNDIKNHDLILTTYPLLLRDKDIILAHQYHTIILDEAQTIKNSNAKITQIANQIKANQRLCMTGTPLENHLGELWSLFNFLLPGYLGTNKQFSSIFRNPIEKDNDTQKVKMLTKRIKPFILRRTKQEVMTELPPKTEIIRTVELEGEQRDLYETIRVSMHEKVQQEINKHGMDKSHIIILDALLKLRQVCCDPALLKIESAKNVSQSAKRTELINMLIEMLDEGRKILLFSQFTSMLQLIEQQLNSLNISYVKLTGQTKDRETPIRNFQEGKVSLFLISLKAGGVGLNLTAADTIIHYDPWWNPAVENQATDRAYRIGQDKPVFVYKMVTSGTVEEKIIEMQKKKSELINNLLDPNSKISSKLTMNDIRVLFEPLAA